MALPKTWVVYRKVFDVEGRGRRGYKHVRTDGIYFEYPKAQEEAKRRSTNTGDKHVVKRVELVATGR